MILFICVCVCVCACVCVQLSSTDRSVSVCDDSPVRLQCDGDDMLKLTVRWTADLSDLPTSDLPDLHDVGEQSQMRLHVTVTPQQDALTTPLAGKLPFNMYLAVIKKYQTLTTEL